MHVTPDMKTVKETVFIPINPDCNRMGQHNCGVGLKIYIVNKVINGYHSDSQSVKILPRSDK